MSDQSQGPGWWMASDGKWYAPERTAGYAPPPVAPSSPAAGDPEKKPLWKRRWFVITAAVLVILMIASALAPSEDEVATEDTATTTIGVPAPLSDAELGEKWQEVADDWTGELRAAGFPNPRDDPYEETGTAATALQVKAAYLEVETGYRPRLLDLFELTEGRLPYVNQDLRARIQRAGTPEEMWELVADITGYVIRPLTGWTPSPTTTVAPTTTTTTTVPTTTEAPTTTTTAAPAMSPSQAQAIGAAEDYLAFSHFSRQGLIDQLSSEYGDQFSVADATFAVDRVSPDWNEQAAGSARDYLEFSSFSCQGLIDQLSSDYGDQYTPDQARYGATSVGIC